MSDPRPSSVPLCPRCGEDLTGQGVTHECRPPISHREALAFLEDMLVQSLDAAFPVLEAKVKEAPEGTVEREDCEVLVKVAKMLAQGLRADVDRLGKKEPLVRPTARDVELVSELLKRGRRGA